MTTLPQTTPMRLPRPMAPTQITVPGANGHGQLGPALPHQAAPGGGMSGADVWRVIRANLWLIALLLVVGAIGSYLVNSWLAAHHSRYTSTAQIRVQVNAELPRLDAGPIFSVDPMPANIELEQQTQTAMLTNRNFIGTILGRADTPIRNTKWFASFNGDVEEAKEDLLEKLSVSPRPNTRVIEVSMSCPDPRDAQVIVEEIVKRHIEARQTTAHEAHVKRQQDLTNLRNQYQAEADTMKREAMKRAADLEKEGDSVDVTSSLVFKNNDLNAELARAKADQFKAESKLGNFEKQVQMNLVPEELHEYLNHDPVYTQMKIELQNAILRADEAEGALGAKNPKVKAMRDTVEAMRQKIDDLENQARAEAQASIVQRLKDDAIGSKLAVDDIQKDINGVRDILAKHAALKSEYHFYDERRRIAQENLTKVQNDIDKLENLVSNPQAWSTAELSNAPDLPDKPSFPKLWVSMTLGLSVALLLGLGIAFLREVTDTTVRSPRDIAKVGQLSLLGMIPHEADDPEAAGSRLPLAIFEAPHSVIAEQFRQVRTRLQHGSSLDTTRSILVTGPSPGDGKTTVACNLAAGLALNGRRILLVDANFRRPQLHTTFNLPNEIGFGDVMNALETFDEAVRETDVPNLSVLTSGVRPANATELLESQLLIDFIERALEEYDHVIFDSGPMLIVSETVALAPRVDGVISVVRARGNSRGLLQRMRDQLRQLKAEHLGVILNAVRSQGGGYYGQTIKTYYAYQTNGG